MNARSPPRRSGGKWFRPLERGRRHGWCRESEGRFLLRKERAYETIHAGGSGCLPGLPGELPQLGGRRSCEQRGGSGVGRRRRGCGQRGGSGIERRWGSGGRWRRGECGGFGEPRLLLLLRRRGRRRCGHWRRACHRRRWRCGGCNRRGHRTGYLSQNQHTGVDPGLVDANPLSRGRQSLPAPEESTNRGDSGPWGPRTLRPVGSTATARRRRGAILAVPTPAGCRCSSGGRQRRGTAKELRWA